MKTINFKTYKFAIGRLVVATESYKEISVGDIGIVEKITFESLPDFGLFDIRMIHMNFGDDMIIMGEDVARRYFHVR